MAKSFAKAKQQEVQELEDEDDVATVAATEEEDEEEAATPKAAKEKKPKGAPRARKWNYGIQLTSKIIRTKDAVPPKSVAEQFPYTAGNPTVAKFKELGGDGHGLRVMMRAGTITLNTAGETYPKPWDAAAYAAQQKVKADAAKAKAAAKAAKEDDEEEEPIEAKPAKKAKK
jgi:hypothetical protein